ncbi:Serine/threonine-protein kinase PknL [Enhygromyxa salina]|uniref:Serine/threonine-protein kinase PknL n=1 Tax=Enhygromyxa salina TaxID=215803 RepID=A0A2S9XLU4_9BACT|nr:serine/threonine-protein kinase [Enhygromyxa salina]PRP93822.1 Serine/threonine-protein kinase PknL [Enhygromyxa salina]
MASVQGPETADGRPEYSGTGDARALATATATAARSATQSESELVTRGELAPNSALATLATPGMSEQAALAVGERLGQADAEFEIVKPLGAGGMGQVFAARRLAGEGAGELVALKCLEQSSANLLYRFKQEFRALAGVTHDNLVSLGELVVLPDATTFFTMELIDGVPFNEYVRGRTPEGELPNLARLRRALRQLAAGVRELHQHGCIHRDLKPSNVLVTEEGRVVVLDFGLIQDHSEAQHGAADDQIMGTPAYMSPEQAGLEPTGPAADWYAVGVMLFECLCGVRPHSGSVAHILFAKRDVDAPDIAEIVPDIPPDLAALCRRLLARDPVERPSVVELLAILDGRTDTGSGAGLGSASGSSWGMLTLEGDSMIRARAPFVGRAPELAQLERAFAGIHGPDRHQVTVHIRGRSGYGKSAIVREFIRRVRRRERVVVIQGRCLERESVPYKGLDPVIDALSVYLRQLPPDALASLKPAHAVALARLFPVLDDLWRTPASRTSGLDVHELRQRAFAALRELFDGVAKRRPLIVFIDDFHWANVDSARLLTSLVSPPEAPPMLLAVTYRDEQASNEPLRALLAPAALAGRDVRKIRIGPLADDEAHALAKALMGDSYDSATADSYARGAEGSPFYVAQMVHGASTEGATPGQLDQLVVRRILQLDPDSRRLLEVVAVAGRPVAREVAFTASELDDPAALLPDLRSAELLVARSRDSGSKVLETAHARIREVAVGELERDELRATHLRLARALEHHGSDPEALAEHFDRGGDRARAADYYERAAAQAANSLAFLRAVALLRTTLELLPEASDPARIEQLRVRLATQLINVGRGHEAAQLLLSLASEAEQRGRADAVRAREYRRLAADQLIKTGHVDEGLAELDNQLRSVGMRLPATRAGAVAALVWEQLRLRVRGFAFVRREAKAVAPARLDQVDTCFAVVNGLSTQETLLSALFHFRNLRLSLATGEPYRVARALAYQCVIDVAGGDWRRVEDHLQVSRSLVAELDDPQLVGFIDLCEASIHWFERRYPTSAELHSEIIERLEGVAGASWDRRTAQIHHMWTLVCQGRFREFWTRAKGTTEGARERGDMQELVEVSSFMAVALISAGKVERAREVLSAALDEWKPGRYLFGDVWAFYAQVRILLHAREPEQAIALAQQTLTQMKRTFLAEHRLARHNVEELLCRSYLAAAIERDEAPGARRGHARRARRLAAKLRAVDNPVLTGHVAVIEAGLATLEGDRDVALRRWAEAAAVFEAHGMRGDLAVVRARSAWVLGDEGEGPDFAAHAAGYFELEDIEDSEGFARIAAPAHPRICEPRGPRALARG